VQCLQEGRGGAVLVCKEKEEWGFGGVNGRQGRMAAGLAGGPVSGLDC